MRHREATGEALGCIGQPRGSPGNRWGATGKALGSHWGAMGSHGEASGDHGEATGEGQRASGERPGSHGEATGMPLGIPWRRGELLTRLRCRVMTVRSLKTKDAPWCVDVRSFEESF